jgi:hypothetical protein
MVVKGRTRYFFVVPKRYIRCGSIYLVVDAIPFNLNSIQFTLNSMQRIRDESSSKKRNSSERERIFDKVASNLPACLLLPQTTYL